MFSKIINKIKNLFASSSKKEEKCEHVDRTVKTVRYCSDCKLVLDES